MKAKKFFSAVLISAFIFLSSLAALAANDDVVRIGVMKFASKASGVSSYQAEAITDEFTRMLASSQSIAVIEREQLAYIAREHRINMSGLVDTSTAVQIGRIAGLQYIITGAVTQFDATTKDEKVIWVHEISHEARVTIDMRVIDVQTAEVVFAIAETGTATYKNSSFALDKDLRTTTSDSGRIQEAAISDAVAKLGYRLKEAVVGEYSQVLKAGGRDIYINIGATSGARPGNLYKVYMDGEEIYDMNGRSLGKNETPLAVIKVDTVENDYSIARIVKGGGNPANIQRGDKVEPISQGEAKKLKIPSKRPHHYIGTSNLEGAELDNRLENLSANQGGPGLGGPSAASVTPSPSPAPVAKKKASHAYENYSTDPGKVIKSYGLPSGQENTLRISHINANKLNNKRAYDKFVELANANKEDYLAAFRAGETARSLGDRDSAKQWFERALKINPNYEPAQKALEKLNSAPAKKSSSKRRKK